MRSRIHAQKLRALSKSSALLGLMALATACSSGASRLDQLITSSVEATQNQSSIISGAGKVAQQYPGDVASNVTNTGIRVAKRATSYETIVPKPVAPSVTRTSLPTLERAKNAVKSMVQPKSAVDIAKEQVIERVAATSKVSTYDAKRGGFVLPPRQAPQNPLRMMGTDNMVTGSIKKPVKKPVLKTARTYKQTQKSAPASNAVGWKNTQGTRVTVKDGETLYNLSRRYGVPVNAILAANNMPDANAVQAGQRILIPTYNFSNSAPVSAPDSNPVTKASRASRGFQGQARNVVTVPKRRGQKVAAKTAPIKLPKPTNAVVGSLYKVQSGDTLNRIAQRHGTSVAALKAANDLSNNSIRIGQTLRISGSGTTVAAREIEIDPVTTANVPPRIHKQKGVNPVYTKPTEEVTISKRAEEKVATAATSGASAFRWPASGRVISKFGERTPNGVNDGIDISVPVGTPIKASENGTVIYSGSELEDFGKLILVSHKGGWVTAYAHASAALVRRGDKVRRGQVIAKSGRTGNAKTPKLHFEIRKNSKPINPLGELSK